MLSDYSSHVIIILRLADDRLILGHRLSELCGHAPILEEDLAMANIALDLLGQAHHFFHHAAQLENKGKTVDDLVFFRDERAFFNLLMVELSDNNFAFIIVRQLLYSLYENLALEALKSSKDVYLSNMALRSSKEISYHTNHAKEWFYRLADGTETSRKYIEQAIEKIWCYTNEFFIMDIHDKNMVAKGIIYDRKVLKNQWFAEIKDVFGKVGLQLPKLETYPSFRGRQGIHSESLGHLLAQMQYIPRAYPTAKWD